MRHKGAAQSFSDVIKEQLGRRMTGRDLRKVIAAARFSTRTLDAIEGQVRARRVQHARRVKL